MESNYQKVREAETELLRTLVEQGLSDSESFYCCLFLLADVMAAEKPRYENADRDALIDSLDLVLNHIQIRRTQVKILNILKQQNN